MSPGAFDPSSGVLSSMRITGPQRINVTSPSRRSKQASAASSNSFEVGSSEEVQDTTAASAPQALAAVDSLLALQEVDDPTQGKKKAAKRAEDMLDLLEGMRLDLISGGVPLTKLHGLIKLVEARREAFDDPQLSDLIDEIELRAQVEIAKLQMHEKQEDQHKIDAIVVNSSNENS